VGVLGVLRDTPDYKRFKRAGRLVEGAKYTGDSGMFSRELSFVPVIEPEELLKRHRYTVQTLNSPARYFERCLTLFANRHSAPVCRGPLGWTQIAALAKSLWGQGGRGHYRWVYWKYLYRVVTRHTRYFPDAVRLAVQGNHLILATQQALQVDEVKTFYSEALAFLEAYCQDYREVLQRNVGEYAGRLMQAVHSRLEHYRVDRLSVQHNASVLLAAGEEYCEAIRKEFRQQVQEPLDRFQKEVERILETYAPGDGPLTHRLQ